VDTIVFLEIQQYSSINYYKSLDDKQIIYS
jgi:hypothetical protein